MTTGWPPGLLQDDDRKLSRWFASRPDARYQLRKNMKEDIIKLARAAAIKFAHWDDWDSNEPASGPNGNEPHEEREYWISVVEFIADVAPPPRREWVGLTDEDVTLSHPYSVTRDKGCFYAGALWADAKLKEKNT